MNKELFDGAEKAHISKLVVKVKQPTEKKAKTSEGEDVCKFKNGGDGSFENKIDHAGGPENVNGIKAPTEHCSGNCGDSCPNCESDGLLSKTEMLYRAIMEADGVGLDTQSAPLNVDNTGFDDTTGDLGGGVEDDEPEDDDIEDEEDEDDRIEAQTAIKLAIKTLRDVFKKLGGDPDDIDKDDEEDEEDDDLGDLDVDDEEGESQPQTQTAPAPQPPAAPAPQAPAAPMPQQESVQLVPGKKSTLGPKMSQRAPGKLGKKSARKFGWHGKKRDASGTPSRLGKSSFGPKMTQKAPLKVPTGDFIQ